APTGNSDAGKADCNNKSCEDRPCESAPPLANPPARQEDVQSHPKTCKRGEPVDEIQRLKSDRVAMSRSKASRGKKVPVSDVFGPIANVDARFPQSARQRLPFELITEIDFVRYLTAWTLRSNPLSGGVIDHLHHVTCT